jgi:NodT family efflux transporter outer membrane factor (OMF) lipoprotein
MMRKIVALATAGLLAGCSMTPQYVRPELPAPPTWQNGQASAADGAEPSPEWWKSFASAELDRLEGTAAPNSHDLKAAVSRVAEAQAQAKIAGSALYPSLIAGGSATRVQSASSPHASRKAATTLYNGTLTASYEVDFWGKNRAAANSADDLVTASRYDSETVELTVLSNVASTYFQILTLDDRLKVARDSLANANTVLAVVEAQSRLGKISDLELAQQRTAVAGFQSAIPALEQQKAQALDALAVFLGSAPEGFGVNMTTLAGLTLPAIGAGLPSSLLERRPDVQKAGADLRSANQDIGFARAQLLPSINLTAQGGVASAALNTLMNPASMLYTLAASITAPLFTGGKLTGQVDLARARDEELAQVYQQTVISAFRDVEDALAAASDLALVEQAQQAQVAAAQQAYQLADMRYRAGLTDYLTMLVTQSTLYQAEDALAQTHLARFNAAVSLYKALGGGWGGQAA